MMRGALSISKIGPDQVLIDLAQLGIDSIEPLKNDRRDAFPAQLLRAGTGRGLRRAAPSPERWFGADRAVQRVGHEQQTFGLGAVALGVPHRELVL